MPNSTESAEDRLIARYFRPLAVHPGALGLHDDAAILTPPAGCDLVLTTDGVIAGVHFFPDDAPHSIGRKALRMNLSDLAAKGAKPAGFLISLALSAGTDEAWIAEFASGLGEDAERYGCPLLGGDTDHTPGPTSVSIAAFGVLQHGTMVRRSTAKVGDCLLVTGTIGDSALALVLLRNPELLERWPVSAPMAAYLSTRYLLPEPRSALAEAIRLHASAAMDVSDGLAGDVAKLARASSLAVEIDVSCVPLSDAARAVVAAVPEVIETLLTGGDDYEIILTLAPEKLPAFRAAAQVAGVPVSEIGRMQAGEGARFIRDGNALAFARSSYSHF